LAIHFVNEAYRHGKPIAAVGNGALLLDVCSLVLLRKMEEKMRVLLRLVILVTAVPHRAETRQLYDGMSRQVERGNAAPV
jgi:hypothetical protein